MTVHEAAHAAGIDLRFDKREGSRMKREQAERYGQELLRLASKGVALTPQNVLREAEHPGSPLHDYFDWDNTEAAESWRRWQARQMCNSIRVEYRKDPEAQPVMVPLLVSLRSPLEAEEIDEGAREYVPISVIMESEDMMQAMMEQAARDLKSFKRRYSALALVSQHMDALDALLLDLKAANGNGQEQGK